MDAATSRHSRPSASRPPRETAAQSRRARATRRSRGSTIAPTAGSQVAQAREWLISAAHIIEQLTQPNQSLTSIAEKFSLSYETFRKKFTHRFGVSPQRYRMRHLMQKAIILLNEENLSVKETASRLGFCDEFYFSRAFRKLTGRPPSSLRKKSSQENS